MGEINILIALLEYNFQYISLFDSTSIYCHSEKYLYSTLFFRSCTHKKIVRKVIFFLDRYSNSVKVAVVFLVTSQRILA